MIPGRSHSTNTEEMLSQMRIVGGMAQVIGPLVARRPLNLDTSTGPTPKLSAITRLQLPYVANRTGHDKIVH